MPVFRRDRRQSATDIERRIRVALDELRPLLGHDAAVELLRFDAASGVAQLRVGGGCPDCEMTVATLTQGIEAHLRRRVPEVESVQAESLV